MSFHKPIGLDNIYVTPKVRIVRPNDLDENGALMMDADGNLLPPTFGMELRLATHICANCLHPIASENEKCQCPFCNYRPQSGWYCQNCHEGSLCTIWADNFKSRFTVTLEDASRPHYIPGAPTIRATKEVRRCKCGRKAGMEAQPEPGFGLYLSDYHIECIELPEMLTTDTLAELYGKVSPIEEHAHWFCQLVLGEDHGEYTGAVYYDYYACDKNGMIIPE